VDSTRGLKSNDPKIHEQGLGFEFVDDPRINRLNYEKLCEAVRIHLVEAEIIDEEEART